jgi:chaperonin GroEL
MKEKKARMEDALNATRAAVEEGIVPGGGVALLRCMDALDNVDAGGEETHGVAILKRALQEPLRQIVANAGLEGSVVVNKVIDGQDDFGFNAATDTYENLIAAGVIDPTKVVRFALQNAASVAGLMLTTEAMIADQPKKKKKSSVPMR